MHKNWITSGTFCIHWFFVRKFLQENWGCMKPCCSYQRKGQLFHWKRNHPLACNSAIVETAICVVPCTHKQSNIGMLEYYFQFVWPTHVEDFKSFSDHANQMPNGMQYWNNNGTIMCPAELCARTISLTCKSCFFPPVNKIALHHGQKNVMLCCAA